MPKRMRSTTDIPKLPNYFSKALCIPIVFGTLVSGNEKWISIQPMGSDKPSMIEHNRSKGPVGALEGIKRLQRLMDKQSLAEKLNTDTAKKWYRFDEPDTADE